MMKIMTVNWQGEMILDEDRHENENNDYLFITIFKKWTVLIND